VKHDVIQKTGSTLIYSIVVRGGPSHGRG